MRITTPTGNLFSSSSTEAIDDWSREVFDALSAWALTMGGRWLRYDPGYLLLEIEKNGGRPIDPILMDTADEELTVEFGMWEMHLPDQALDAAGAASEAVKLVSQWLAGAVRTAVFTDDTGKWCGTMLIERGDEFPPRPSDGMAYFKPTQVEVRGPDRSAWQSLKLAH
jgi:hypothetical protein